MQEAIVARSGGGVACNDAATRICTLAHDLRDADALTRCDHAQRACEAP